jgi:Fe-S-cluster containining protein
MILWAIQTILSSRRAGLMRLRKVQGPTALVCLREECGRCCNVLGGAEVDPSEAEPLKKLDALREVATGLRLKCEGSRCALLRENLCSAYEVRPRACKEYPWYNVNGTLYYDRGCPGIRHDLDEQPDPKTLVPVETYFSMFPRLVRPLVIRLLRAW